MNPLEQYPEVRKALYTVQWVVSGVMLILGVVWASLPDVGVPDWYVVLSAALSALWAYTGLTAASNTPTPGNLPVTTPLEDEVVIIEEDGAPIRNETETPPPPVIP